MFDDMKHYVKDWKDKDGIHDYLLKLLNKEAFDRSGLIYGMGHAIYSLSDPRAKIFKKGVENLAKAKGLEEEYMLYATVEDMAAEIIAEHRRIYKGVCANVDFYSGFAYKILNIPEELFTPIFACARIVGWSAHRLEELVNSGKIIRPAYMSISHEKKYKSISER